MVKKDSTKRFKGSFHSWAVKWLVLAASIASSANAQTPSRFVLENIETKPGEIATGFVEVPAGIDGGTRIPVSVFHGPKNGKVLLIISGIHGSEYAPILALQKLRSQIDPKELSGTVILVHVANMPSFLKRTIYYGPDGKNLNRSFPGKPDGTITERIAFALTEKLIKRADYVVDAHCGDNNESLRPYTGFTQHAQSTGEYVEMSERMARAIGIDLIKISTGRAVIYDQAAYSTNLGALLGKPTIAIESGELGKPEPEAVARIERGLLNMMRELKLLSGNPIKLKDPLFIKRDQTLRSTVTGLFYSFVSRDQRVKENEPLGYVTDFFGNRLQEVRAPFAGVVMYYTATPAVNEGEPLINLGEIENKKQ
jgi:predicted deacylase